MVPEVIQSSAMDCGPASLKAMLEGFGIPVSYGRLREACQTDVDGTSISRMDDIANQLGLETEEIMVPADHVGLSPTAAFPAIAVVRHSTGGAHFVVIWRQWGALVQVMDPAIGRLWITRRQLQGQLYRHAQPVSVADWRQWAGEDENLLCLQTRLAPLGATEPVRERLLQVARDDASWYGLARLDAAVRLIAGAVRANGLRRGREASAALQHLMQSSSVEIPRPFWSVEAVPSDEEEQALILHGVVLVRALARRSPEEAVEPSDSPTLLAALTGPTERPGAALWRLMRADGLASPSAALGMSAVAAAAVLLEALLFSGLVNVGQELGLAGSRLGAIGALLLFSTGVLLLELPAWQLVLGIGRRLETRLRMEFLRKIPRLGHPYFASRLMSDMAERGHSLHAIRQVPVLARRFVSATLQLFVTTIGIAWIDPMCAPIALAAVLIAMGVPTLAQPLLAEQDLQVRTRWGGLSRFYLDALMGATPILAHGARWTMQREHERLTVQWCQAGLRLQRSVVVVQGLVSMVGFAMAVALVAVHLASSGETSAMLLLIYWALKVPALAQEIALCARQAPALRNVTLRILEPLGAPEEPTSAANTGKGFDEPDTPTVPAPAEPAEPKTQPDAAPSDEEPMQAVSLSVEAVTVRLAGHTVLRDIDLHVPCKQHVAVVGPSGAGKSTLMALFLGWQRPWHGKVLVNGHPAAGKRLAWLRRHTAWVDPDVQVWNRSLHDNLRYGSPESSTSSFGTVLEQSDLMSVLLSLPEGLATPLGEGGGSISGGEGQRVRLARAFLRQGVRLAVLDEPFRGLDRHQRSELLRRARKCWQNATLLCVTHDVGQAIGFDEVWVVENGRIVERGVPEELAAEPKGRFRTLLDAENATRAAIFSPDRWRRLHIDNGRLLERATE
jgi:ATP-binding cassette subfamily B protein